LVIADHLDAAWTVGIAIANQVRDIRMQTIAKYNEIGANR